MNIIRKIKFKGANFMIYTLEKLETAIRWELNERFNGETFKITRDSFSVRADYKEQLLFKLSTSFVENVYEYYVNKKNELNFTETDIVQMFNKLCNDMNVHGFLIKDGCLFNLNLDTDEDIICLSEESKNFLELVKEINFKEKLSLPDGKIELSGRDFKFVVNFDFKTGQKDILERKNSIEVPYTIIKENVTNEEIHRFIEKLGRKTETEKTNVIPFTKKKEK
jgi:hypothetical protein